jgi:methyl-accepting chemotaxis protein
MSILPRLSIATKLYAIFALLAIATVALAIMAVVSARHHATLTHKFEEAFRGAQYVERLNGLIYAIRLESRGALMARSPAAAAPFIANLRGHNDRVDAIVKEWRATVGGEDAKQFEALTARINQFQEFNLHLMSHADNAGGKSIIDWNAIENDSVVRAALNKDLEALAALGVFLIRRSVARPLEQITRVTEVVATGGAVSIPYGTRRDEIGALARSIAVFQRVMNNNRELNDKVADDVAARASRQVLMSKEIQRFSGEVEAGISELGAICDRMLAASTDLVGAADRATQRTASATTASSEASSNVRDIASAADELAASVMEIDRQVGQSNAIAEKAVGEAERTNAAVQELDQAAKRIGDVVRLITDIAEQTNLLALNATIEAARAGEAGRGFAVVAGEVKALAGQTAKATEDIAAQIADMQHATERSIAAIGAIERTIRDIGSISGAIAAAVTEQGAATQEIARSVEIAAKRTDDTAEEVGRVGDATENTRASVHIVTSVADELGAVAGRIRGQVDAFFERLRAA